jgi:mRNA interferase MazF
MVGEIYLVRLLFSDFTDSKIRPVLVIKDYEEDVLVLPLTTSLNRKGIIIKSEELVEGELKKDSIVITNKPFFISKSLLIRKIGKVSKDKFFSIKHELCNELNCYR